MAYNLNKDDPSRLPQNKHTLWTSQPPAHRKRIKPAGFIRQIKSAGDLCLLRLYFSIEDKQRTVTDIELYGIAKILNASVTELFEKKFFRQISVNSNFFAVI